MKITRNKLWFIFICFIAVNLQAKPWERNVEQAVSNLNYLIEHNKKYNDSPKKQWFVVTDEFDYVKEFGDELAIDLLKTSHSSLNIINQEIIKFRSLTNENGDLKNIADYYVYIDYLKVPVDKIADKDKIKELINNEVFNSGAIDGIDFAANQYDNKIPELSQFSESIFDQSKLKRTNGFLLVISKILYYLAFDQPREFEKAWLGFDKTIVTGANFTIKKESLLSVLRSINLNSNPDGNLQIINSKLLAVLQNDNVVSTENPIAKNIAENQTYVQNYTSEKLEDLEFLNDLYQGNRSFRSEITRQTHQDTKAVLIITDDKSEEESGILFSDIADYQPPEGFFKIWIHKDKNDQYELKSSFPIAMRNTITSLNEAGIVVKEVELKRIEATKTINIISKIYYDVFDFLAKGVSKAKIPPSVWDCADDSYNSKYRYTYTFLTTAISPFKVLTGVDNFGGEQVFAAQCGIWNGIIDILNVFEFLQLGAGLLNSEVRGEYSEMLKYMKKFEHPDDPSKTGFLQAIYYSLESTYSFDDCLVYHDVSGIVIGVALAFINPQAIVTSLKGVAGNTLLVVIRTVKLLDDMADPFLAFKFVMKGSKPLIKAINKTTKQVYYLVADNLYILKVWVNNGWELQYRSAAVLKVVGNNADGSLNVSLDGVSLKIMGMEESLANFLEVSQELIESLKRKGLRVTQLEELHKLPDFEDIVKRLDAIEFDDLKGFTDDLLDSKKFRDYFSNINRSLTDQELLDSWAVLKKTEIDGLSGKVENLESLNKALKQDARYDADYFETLLKSKDDPQKFLDDYVSKIGDNGKFADDALEPDYTSYLSRKAREGKPPRDRADWNQASDYMKYDSPTARGNKFNKKAEFEYDINELNLVREDGSFVRVDSYVPASASSTGEGMIISRKATDLVDIKESTFRGHLQEMVDKYSPGTEIRSNAYPQLNGKTIEGKQYLQIPESNKSFYDIEKYKSIAKDEYGIEIIFLAE